MKFSIVMSCLCILGGSLHAQDEAAQKVKKETLVDLIVESDVVYKLVGFGERDLEKWEALSGNKDINQYHIYRLRRTLSAKRIENLKKSLEEAGKNKKFSPGDLVLHFQNTDYREKNYLDLDDYSAKLYDLLPSEPLPNSTIKFPKYAGLRDDLIWMCKNRYLLKLLKKGELTVDTYHFSPHEMQFLVMVCTEEYLKGLHKYAESEVQGDKLDTLYQFMDFAPANQKEFTLLNEVAVERLANAIDDQIKDELMFTDVAAAFRQVTKKIKEGHYLTQRDKRLIRSFFVKNENAQMMQNEMAGNMKAKILEQKDIQLLKIYLQRVEIRQSIADVVNLAELVQSRAFLEGAVEFQEPIMRQFSLRKEKEVVWILAPLLKHKDPELAERARIIMGRITHKNLGEDPADWRAWYTEQNK